LTKPARHFRIDLAYDGTEFAGWQTQAQGRTVQGTLETALSRLQGERPVRVRGAGRTDSGVHARAQVADFRLSTDLDVPALEHALRGMLPHDLRPVRLREVADAFDSRGDATSKTYRYLLDRTGGGDPFLARFALHHPYPIDRGSMDQALLRLPGEHDWSGFAGAKCEVKSRTRNLTEAFYEEHESGDQGWFSFSANGFLTHMVRILVGTSLEVARGRFDPERIDRILASRDRALAGPTAPAKGLVLWSITYPGDAT
jgi:tRNA pseudouridine38-40 synthase